jgi:prepilin signal peptidase PulO-like enzyme (type II secretory pathway)
LNALVAVPLGWRVLASFLIGTVAGALANWAIYAVAFEHRPISPWSRAHPRDADDRWLDRLPLVGWLRLRRKGSQFGYEFWLRPLMVELLAGLLFAGLYLWEIGEHALVFPPWPAFAGAALASFAGTLHAQLAAHWLLTFLLLIATFIDLDELTIPDAITVPGTLLGLAWMAFCPASALPWEIDWNQPAMLPLHLTAPRAWPASLAGWPEGAGLSCGLTCYLLWCFALLPRPWRTRRGYRRAMGILLTRIVRDSYARVIGALALLGSAAIVVAWYIGGLHWQSLLSSLVGLAVGMLMVWSVRILGTWALRREAMGFGDVTLLGMIGAFLGWQPVLLVFFFAPFAGLVFGLIQLLVRREKVMPFGPFLCLAALGVIVAWPALWNRTIVWFEAPWLVPAAVAVCLVALAVSLTIWATVKRLLFKA